MHNYEINSNIFKNYTKDEKIKIKYEINKMLTCENNHDIHFTDNELQTIFNSSHPIYFGKGNDSSANSASKSLKIALNNAIMENCTLNDTKEILVHFTMHPDYPILDIANAMEIIEEDINKDTVVICGTKTSIDFKKNYVKVIIILKY